MASTSRKPTDSTMSSPAHAPFSSAFDPPDDLPNRGPLVETSEPAERSADVRGSARARVAHAIAQREGGEATADLGKHAQALLLLRASVVATREAIELLARAEASTQRPRDARDALAALAARLTPLESDAHDPAAGVGAEVRRHRALLRGVHSTLLLVVATPAQRTKARRERLGAFALVGGTILVAAIASVVALRTPKAISSGDLGGAYAAALAVDGDRASEWLLPGGEAGWLDVHLRPRRRVERVRLVNATNAPFGDRGTKGFRLEGFLDDVLVWSSREESFAGAGEVRELAVGARVNRLRIVVLSWHGAGAGLAEVVVQ